jgi:signal transduction histidine kinase
MTVPVLNGSQLIGQIAVANAGRDYTDEDLNILQRLSLIYSIAVQRKRMEVDLKEFNSALERRVTEETNRRMMQERLLIQQSKMAAMGEMIGAIAHQWRQPLNSISMIVADLKDAYEFGEFNKDYLDDSVKNTLAQITHMSGTIDDFRNFFKPDKEKVIFKINTVVKEVIHLVHDQMMKANINISLDCRYDAVRTPGDGKYAAICTCEPQLQVSGYPNELKQAVLNLLANARDAVVNKRRQGAHSKDGGEILVELSRTDRTVILEIKDNGGGIPVDIIDRIFEPYFTTKQHDGTGIGLHMSKVIVEQNMGGTIGVANGEKGAVFTIELPLEETQANGENGK